MHLQAAVDGFDVFARSLSIGAETMVMKFRPELPMHDRYAVSHDFLTPEVGNEVLTISRLINAFFRWEFNSCETLVRGTEAHPIDYANASPDVAVTSLHYYFPWAMTALLRWCVFCVVTGRGPRMDLETRHYFEIGDREDLSYEEKLAGYRGWPTSTSRSSATGTSATAGCAHVEEMVSTGSRSAEFDRLLVETVRSTYPAHEQERFVAHFRGLVGQWVGSQRLHKIGVMLPRLNRLFAADGRCFDVAVDHGFFNEGAFLTGIEDMAAAVATLVDAAPDAIQLSPGQAPPSPGPSRAAKPALVLRTDVANVYAPELPRDALQRDRRGRGRHGACGSTPPAWSSTCCCSRTSPSCSAQCMRNVSALRAACDAGRDAADGRAAGDEESGYGVDGDVEKIVPLVRQATELGADVIKADPTDDLAEYHRVIEAAAGGPCSCAAAAGSPTRRCCAARGRDGAGRRRHRLRPQRHPAPRPGRHDARADGRSCTTSPDARYACGGFGIIGGGLMGREFASRRRALAAPADIDVRPEIVARLRRRPRRARLVRAPRARRRGSRPTGRAARRPATSRPSTAPCRTTCTPSCTSAILEAGKHLLGEKPFGIDLDANKRDHGRGRQPPGAARALLVRDAVLPRRPGRRALVAERAAGADPRGPQRVPALQRPRPEQADQLEAPGGVQRRVRLHGRPRDARAAPAAALRAGCRATCARCSRTS